MRRKKVTNERDSLTEENGDKTVPDCILPESWK